MASVASVDDSESKVKVNNTQTLTITQILATIYGQCIGDAIGLLTEFMLKEWAIEAYGKNPKDLRYDQKATDGHRDCWEVGDWTDDTDQMILILQSILYNKGEVITTDFAKRMKRWLKKGFPEMGDERAYGVGKTTRAVLGDPRFEENPEKVAENCWVLSLKNAAANGCVMRTSILGLHQWWDTEAVIKNALAIGKCTHFDPRCQASVIAVSTCISLMIQHHDRENKMNQKQTKIDVDDLIKKSYEYACRVLETDEQKEELWRYMSYTDINDLELGDHPKIGYTYKCMGAGFWAVKQTDFKKAMIELVMEAGDADTNGAVGGAMLACKLGLDSIPKYWIDELRYKSYMMDLFERFIKLQSEMNLPVEERTSNDHLAVENLDNLEPAVPTPRKEKVEKKTFFQRLFSRNK